MNNNSPKETRAKMMYGIGFGCRLDLETLRRNWIMDPLIIYGLMEFASNYVLQLVEYALNREIN
jgi:hypothetical protein